MHTDDPSADDEGIGTVLNLALSDDGLRLATIGSVDGLAWLDPDTYQVLDRLADVPYFNLFDACDCRTHHASILAWSDDGKYLATTGMGGAIDVRDTEDLSPLVTLLAPALPDENPNWSSEQGPILVRFSPDGGRIVALFPNDVAAYEIELP